jgi:Uma2 family endonuclease
MAAVSPLAKNLAPIPTLSLRRFTPEEYQQLFQAGILGEKDSVELLDGLIVFSRPGAAAPIVRVLSEPNGAASPNSPLPVRPFSVSENHRMIEAGILREGEPVELLGGWLVTKMTRNPPQDLALSLAEHEIDRRLPPAWFRRGQSGVTTSQSEPEPDLAVVRGPRRRYATAHPGPRDMALMVEVADSSLAHDRDFKGGLYARDGIAVYWIVNIPERQVEVYTDPSGPDPNPRYRQRQDFRVGDSVPLILAGQQVGEIPVQDLLP